MGMANQNGGMAGQNGAVYNPAAVNTMPPAGHYSDMQTLMQNMEALSGWLQQNREDFLRVQDDLERVERLQLLRAPTDTEEENGEAEPSEADAQRPTITSLQRELDTARSQNEVLKHQASEHLRLQSQYEDILTEAVERTRDYNFQQNEYIIALHQNYTHLLQEARKETIDAHLTHQAWQASLAKLNGELTKAVKAREQEKDPFRRRLAMLKEENRVMREKLGWEKIVHDSDAEDEELEDGGRGRQPQAAEAVPGSGAVR